MGGGGGGRGGGSWRSIINEFPILRAKFRKVTKNRTKKFAQEPDAYELDVGTSGFFSDHEPT